MNKKERENLKSFHGHLELQLAASKRLLDVSPSLDPDNPPPDGGDTILAIRRPHAMQIAAISLAIRELVKRFPELKLK